MFNWFKENILAPIREGIDEARQEMAEEAEQERAQHEGTRQRIAAVPYEEQFALAIAAPFRSVFLSDWAPVLEDDEAAAIPPLALYSFGESDSLTEKQQQELPELMERDFGIVDNDSAIKATASMFIAVSISDRLSRHADEDSHKLSDILSSLQTMIDAYSEETGRTLRPLKALVSCMAAHAITGSADCGYISKPYAMELMADVAVFVKEHFSGWQDLGEQFLVGEQEVKLNNVIGRRFLRKYVGYLHTKEDSPWRVVPWDRGA